jgi:serine/threonine protein kinase/tetratricopeptide (TPR) repeat protein
LDKKTNPEAISGQRTTDMPNPAVRVGSSEVTTAVDRSTGAEDTPARPPPPGEPLPTEIDRPAAIPDKSLSFLQPGTQPTSLGRLGHYEVLELLGRGGFGIVLKAFDEKLQRPVAIKVLGPQLAGNANARSRFLREARAAAAVRSKYVVSTYAVDEQPIPYLVMEYVAGPTLQDRIDQLAPLGTRDVLRIGAEIAEGLAAAHQQGLIHRDIKPANILLQARGSQPVGLQVKIADFGLARAADDASLTQAGVIAGTPMFMSPEQARGETLDQRSDLFSLGSVLYTMCTGQPPFRASKTLGILKRVCDDTPRPIREINPAIPDALAAIVNRLLVKDPAGRFQTAAAVAERLRQHLAYLDDPSLPPPPGELVGSEPALPPQTKAHPRRRALWLCAAAACALLLAVGGLLLFLHPPRPTEPGTPPGNLSAELEPTRVTEARPPEDDDAPVARAAAGASARGLDFARNGQWALAAKEALAEVAAKPGDRLLWAKAAPRLILAGDVEGYRQLCQRMRQQFRDTTRPEDADSVCKLCLLLPDSSEGLKPLPQLLADALEKPTTEAYSRGWFLACLGLIAYRDGQFEQAADHVKKSVAIKAGDGEAAAFARLVLAMAQHQLKRADEAHLTYIDATVAIPFELATLGTPEYQGALPVSASVVGHDWLMAEILRREAAALLFKDEARTVIAAALRSRGLQLFNRGQLNEAVAALRRALELEERHGWTHYMVGAILVRQGKTDESIPEFRRAIEVAPDYSPPYLGLGTLFALQGGADEAVPLLKKASELEPKSPAAHRLLGQLLFRQGQLDEAAASLGRAIALNAQDGVSIQLRAEVTRLQALLPKLEQFVDGREKPADNAQRLDLARLCQLRRRYAASARFYAALDADPKPTADPAPSYRFNAACAAARAGHGDGDAEKLDAPERARWRRQAIAWLRADLEAVVKVLDAANPAERPGLLTALRRWKADPDLASLRDADQVGKLPDDERALIEKLWSDHDAMLKRNP